MALPEDRVGPLLDERLRRVLRAHQHIRRLFLERFEQVRESLASDAELSEQRRLLIGSYFLAEYSWNPPPCSILPSFRIPTRPACRPAPCGLFSACAPPAKATFPPSLSEPASSIPISGSRYCPPPAFSPSRARSQTPCTRRRCSGGNSRTGIDRRIHAPGHEHTRRVVRAGRSSRRSPGGAVPPAGWNGAGGPGRGAGDLDAGPVQLRSPVPAGTAVVRADLFPATPSQRNGIEDARFVRFRNDEAPTPTTRPSPPTMAGSSCRNWWRLPTSSISGSSP